MTIDKDPVEIDDNFYSPISLYRTAYRAVLPQDVERFATLMQTNDKTASFSQTEDVDRRYPALPLLPSPLLAKQLRLYAGDQCDSASTRIGNSPNSSNVIEDVTTTLLNPAPLPSERQMDRLAHTPTRESAAAPSKNDRPQAAFDNQRSGMNKAIDQTRPSRIGSINDPVTSALFGKRRFHKDETVSLVHSLANVVLQDGPLPPSNAVPMNFEAPARRHDSTPSEHFAELIARHVQQLLVADLENAAIRDPRIMLRLKPETVADTDIFVVKQATGWVVQANTQSPDSHRLLKEGAAALTERFSRRGLGPVTLVVDSEEQSRVQTHLG